MAQTGLSLFLDNLRSLPANLRGSVARAGSRASDRGRSLAVFSNVFLHMHATRVQERTLRFTTTMAMGLTALSLFLICLAP